MEALSIYLIKSSGLIALFYLAYYFMLRKETFFTSNRWFLLSGLCTAAILPLVVYTKIILVAPSAKNFDWSRIPVTNSLENDAFTINWYLISGITYAIGLIVFLVKFAFDFYSLHAVLKGKNIHNQADFKLIDTTENVAPFSYFNTIVYNSSLYSSSELQNILEHEKVHSEQNHTIDVLISRLFCILFWFNPLIWMYKKAILQNLEFIADSEASKKISDKKAYQLTLLKITTHENCVAITNHFYQSLIKKRIVMLNKNQSKKLNSWKYVAVLPALMAFVLLFQIKTIAQEKIVEMQEIKNIKEDLNTVDIYKIDKNITDKELDEKASEINVNYGITTIFSEIKRNLNHELIAITVELKKGKEISKIMELHGNEAIKTFGIVVAKNSKGLLTIDFASEDKMNNTIPSNGIISPNAPLRTEKEIFINGEKLSQNDLDKLDPNDIESIDVIKNSNNQEIRVVTKKYSKTLNENDIYVNDEKVSKDDLLLLDQSTIERMDVDKNKKTIRILTKKSIKSLNEKDIPTPPNPPIFQSGPIPNLPEIDMSKMPTPPVHPANANYKKTMIQFKKEMKEFEAKIKVFEKDSSAHEKAIEDEMAKRSAIFEKQMDEYENAMKRYRETVKK